MPERSTLITGLVFSRMKTEPTRLDVIIQGEIESGVQTVVDEIMESQADLQSALDLLRMDRSRHQQAGGKQGDNDKEESTHRRSA